MLPQAWGELWVRGGQLRGWDSDAAIAQYRAQRSTAPVFNPFWDRSEVVDNPGWQKKEHLSQTP